MLARQARVFREPIQMTTHLLDTLESRRLLSVSIKGGEIFIRGTEGNDTIVFRETVGHGKFRISMNGKVSRTYFSGLNIRVAGRGGDDLISLSDLTFRRNNRIIIDGGDGADTLRGSSIGDQISGGAGDDLIQGAAGNDSLSGDGGQDVLRGGAGGDKLTGGDGNDSLFGEANWDTLVADSGADLLDGGDDLDTADYSFRTDKLVI